MNDCSELEISLRKWERASYEVELRLTQAGDKGDLRLVRNGPALASFDLPRLTNLRGDPSAYGTLLTQQLFGHPEVSRGFEGATSTAAAADVPLRVRLFIGSNAAELHTVRWETLRDPRDTNRRLLLDEQILFSRYLTSVDWRPVRPRPAGDLRALIAVASPEDIERYAPAGRPLAKLNPETEIAQARAALHGMQASALGGGASLTPNNLMARLRDGYDVLYLVAHGALVAKRSEHTETLVVARGSARNGVGGCRSRARGADRRATSEAYAGRARVVPEWRSRRCGQRLRCVGRTRTPTC